MGIENFGKKDLQTLSEMLGEKEFFFGDEPAMLDMVVFSHVAQLVMVDKEFSCPLRDYLEEGCKNLVGLVNRMKDRCWGDHWAEATGETMDLNPHIPKPDPPAPEPEKEKAEEKKEEKEKVNMLTKLSNAFSKLKPQPSAAASAAPEAEAEEKPKDKPETEEKKEEEKKEENKEKEENKKKESESEEKK